MTVPGLEHSACKGNRTRGGACLILPSAKYVNDEDDDDSCH